MTTNELDIDLFLGCDLTVGFDVHVGTNDSDDPTTIERGFVQAGNVERNILMDIDSSEDWNRFLETFGEDTASLAAAYPFDSVCELIEGYMAKAV